MTDPRITDEMVDAAALANLIAKGWTETDALIMRRTKAPTWRLAARDARAALSAALPLMESWIPIEGEPLDAVGDAEQRLSDAESDVQRLHREKMEYFEKCLTYAVEINRLVTALDDVVEANNSGYTDAAYRCALMENIARKARGHQSEAPAPKEG